ncbi:rhomboid family intramembrane serine protease [Fontivita pretiosa]|uniref:rhomboid family intramembrane serine protease n=1 Tax=Fontivita pretiosa TaxID=2989684 RepID=UPI003D16394F
MGIYDREYFRDRAPTSAVGHMRMWSVTTWLIVINVAIFVIDRLLFYTIRLAYVEILPSGQRLPFYALEGLGYFSIGTAFIKYELWRLLTFQFLHGGLSHLFFNMLGLYFFGPMIEAYLGSRRFLAFYLLCGVGGPIAYALLWAVGLLIPTPWIPLVGASAGIFGVLIAAAQIAPNTTVLLYGIFPIQLRTLAWVLLVMAGYTVIAYGGTGQNNAGGEAAHLGGAAVGYLLIHYPHWLRFVDPGGLTRRRRPPPF